MSKEVAMSGAYLGALRDRRDQLLSLGIFIGAALVRIWFVLEHPLSRDLSSDMSVYLLRASNLLNGTLGQWDTFTPVGYPLFVAGIFAVTERSVGAVGIAQCLLGGATAALSFDIFRRISGNRPAAALCAFAVALHVPAIYYASYLLSETLFTFLLTAHVAYAIRSIQQHSILHTLISGFALGCAAIVRTNVLLLIPILPIFLWFAHRESWARFRLFGVCASLAALDPVVSASVHNTVLLREPSGVATNGGLNFYMNFSEVSTLAFTEGNFTHHVQPIPNAIRYSEEQFVPVPFYREQYFYSRGIRLIRENPRRLIRALDNFREAAAVGRQSYWPPWPSQQRALKRYSKWFLRLVIVPALVRLIWLTATPTPFSSC